MGHAGDIAQRRSRAHAVGLATVGTVVGYVHRAKSLARKTVDQRGAAFVGGIGHQQLVGLGAVLRVVSINQRLQVTDAGQAFHMAFAKQIATLADFLDQLLQRNALPLARATRAYAFERRQHTVLGFLVRQHGGATGTAGGTAFQAVIAAQHGIHLTHRRFHGCRVGGCQRVVGVARNAQDGVVVSINTHAHPALRPAAQAARRADHLAGLGRELACDGVETEFGLQRVATGCAGGCRARGAIDQALGTTCHGLAVARRECGQTTGHRTTTQQQAAACNVSILGLFGRVFFISHDCPFRAGAHSF